jgi:hypothetical protein
VAKPRELQDPGLAEVERALSVLEGRHPEHVRVRRETLVAAADRQAALAVARAERARWQRRRGMIVALTVAAFGAAAAVGWRFFTRAHTLRERLDRATAPFAQAGWSEMASNVLTARLRLDVDVPGSSCAVALSTGEEMLVVHQEGRTFEAPHSVAFCTCESSVATVVEATGSSTADAVGISLMRIDARAIGGPLARSWATPPVDRWGGAGADCAEAPFDAWLADGRAPVSPVTDSWLSQEPTRAPLRRAGFQVVATVPTQRAFGAVAAPAGSCVLAVAEAHEPLSLRVTGGSRPISRAQGSLLFCASQASTATVWREGTSPVVMVAAPAEAVGGLLGARECAAAAGLHVPSAATWLSDADLAWDAERVLRASVRAGAATNVAAEAMPAEPGAPDGRLVAVALAPAARIAWEPGGAAPACDPAFGAADTLRESVCMPVAAGSWWRQGDGLASVARAPLPFWLAPLEPVRDPAAAPLVVKLLGLARQLGTGGFAPTLLEGVTEVADGIRVVGRANEDTVVAVGLSPSAPWVFPFTNEIPWKLGESPAMVPLGPGENIKLTASPLSSAPVEKRRTVVFRHEVRR